MNEYLLNQQPPIAIIDIAAIADIQARLSNQVKPLEILNVATAELLAVRAKLQAGAKAGQLAFSPTTDTLTQLSQHIQATIVASSAIQQGQEAPIRTDVLTRIDQALHCLAALHIQLQLDPTQLANHAGIVQRYNARHTVNIYVNDWMQTLLNTEVDRWSQRGQVTIERWIPLASMRPKSVTELTRYIIRAVPIEEQVDENFTSLLFELAKGVHLEWSPSVAPDQLLWQQSQESTLYDYVRAQDFRDRVGTDFAPYLALLLKGSVETYDSVFQVAYESVLREIQRYYLALSPTAPASAATTTPVQVAPATPTTQTPATQPIPITTTPSVAVAPPEQPTPSGPVSIPITTIQSQSAAPTTSIPASPDAGATVDFRHPDQTSPSNQSTIKPINLP